MYIYLKTAYLIKFDKDFIFDYWQSTVSVGQANRFRIARIESRLVWKKK